MHAKQALSPELHPQTLLVSYIMPAPGAPPSYPSCKILGDGVSPGLVHQCIFSTDHIIGTLKKLKLLTIVTITGRGKYIVSENKYY